MSIAPGVHHAAETRLLYSFALRHVPGGARYRGKQWRILIANGIEAGDVLARNNEQVNWSLRLNVAKRYSLGILIHNVGIDLARGNPAKKAVGHAPV